MSQNIELVFFDFKSEFAQEINKQFLSKQASVTHTFNNENYVENYTISTKTSPVQELPEFVNKDPGVAYVSPANSFGYMDGGIDLYYDQDIFQCIQDSVQELIFELNYPNRFVDENDRDHNSKTIMEARGWGVGYLPIGSCLVVDGTSDNPTQKLLVAPTMNMPSYVKGTQNPYYAFLGILKAVSRYNLGVDDKGQKITKILCPGLATGVGGFTFEESATQIYQAFTEFVTHPSTYTYLELVLDPKWNLNDDKFGNRIYLSEPNFTENAKIGLISNSWLIQLKRPHIVELFQD